MKSNKTKSVRILKKDFDQATKQGWSPFTCVLAQTAKRCDIMIETFLPFSNKRAEEIRSVFDNHFFKPGDENKPILQKLRESLPVKVTLTQAT